ncbi:MAG: hypothetical protein IT350_05075 [Deltaproteobacteria bacterium]|nr:hypothetical protein [Deltaproteobacteria bacterium]
MRRWPITLTVLALVLLAASPSWSKSDAENQIEDDVDDIEKRVNDLGAQVDDLTANFSREAFERDKLMLQRRFVAGRDFHFLVRDYIGAAEIFQAIVTHPSAQQLAIYTDAHFYLADSLFNAGYQDESEKRFLEIRSQGAKNKYYGMALARLIQLAILRDRLAQAQNYYSELLSSLPAGSDGSLGRYIYGKALYLRGDRAGATDILEAIPEGADYHPMAQYLLAALAVRDKKFEEATGRLRRLKAALDEPTTPEQEEVRTQTNLALGRLNYEQNDFPQAVSAYTTVKPGDPQFGEAAYESLWVLLTRNDLLLLKIRDETLDFDSLSRDFDAYSDVLDKAAEANDTAAFNEGIEKIETDLADMRDMFAKIDERLTSLQDEAVGRYSDIVANAPKSPHVPEAALLVGNIYAQAENFDAAKKAFTEVQAKYGNYYSQLASARSRLEDPSTLSGMVERGASGEESGKGAVPAGVPEEVAYWLAADRTVRETFRVYDYALRERQNMREIQELIGQVELELRKLEQDPTFPIFKDSYRKSLVLQSDAAQLLARIQTAMGNASITPELSARLSALMPTCTQANARLGQAQQKMAAQKQQALADYRQTFRTLESTVISYPEAVDAVYAEATTTLGETARTELDNIETRLIGYARKAEVGIVDADYRATESSSKKIKQLQKQMEEELRQFKRQYRPTGGAESGGEKPKDDGASKDEPSDVDDKGGQEDDE